MANFFQQIVGKKFWFFFILIRSTTFKYELVKKFGSYGNLNGLKSTAKVLRYKLFEWSKLSALTATNKPTASYTTSVVIHFNSCLLYKTARIVQYSSWTKNVPDVPMSTFVYSCITYARGPKKEGLPIQGEGGGAGFPHMGQLSYSICLEWTRFCIRVTMVTTSSRGLML